jgi:hypothetical protein
LFIYCFLKRKLVFGGKRIGGFLISFTDFTDYFDFRHRFA